MVRVLASLALIPLAVWECDRMYNFQVPFFPIDP